MLFDSGGWFGGWDLKVVLIKELWCWDLVLGYCAQYAALLVGHELSCWIGWNMVLVVLHEGGGGTS